LGMLVRQGALSFKIWTGVDAPIETMMAAALIELAKR
ncbi:MAG: shikimate dehydrogenase, partial [Chloroflexi bacterium]